MQDDSSDEELLPQLAEDEGGTWWGIEPDTDEELQEEEADRRSQDEIVGGPTESEQGKAAAGADTVFAKDLHLHPVPNPTPGSKDEELLDEMADEEGDTSTKINIELINVTSIVTNGRAIWEREAHVQLILETLVPPEMAG